MSKRNGQKEGNKEGERGRKEARIGRGIAAGKGGKEREMGIGREGKSERSFTHADNNFAVAQRSRVCASVLLCVYMYVYVRVCVCSSVCVSVYDVSLLLAVCRAVKGCH